MTDLMPGAQAINVVDLLADGIRDGNNLLGRIGLGIDLLNDYREWANQTARNLRLALTPGTLDELILTHGYDRLMQLDPAAYGTGIATFVFVELEATIGRLDAAREEIDARRKDWSVWSYAPGGAPLNVVVLDTNVLLRRAEILLEMDWGAGLRVRPHEPIALAVPIVVVEEIDRLKAHTGRMLVDEDERPTKELARAAIKVLDEAFDAGSTRTLLRQHEIVGGHHCELWLGLLLDDLRHARLPTNDAEIIDRTLALRPFAAGVALATGDRAMRFQARNAGLAAFDPQVRR